jgi:hypothetical protein
MVVAGMVLALLVAPPAWAQCNQEPAAVESFRAVLRSSSNASYLDRFGLRITPDDSIVIVTDPALCRRAADIIALDVNVPKDRFSIVLGRVKANHVAQTNQPMGAFQELFVFDSTMALLLPRDTLMSISNAPTPATESKCFGPENDFSRSVGGKIRFVLTDPRQSWYRNLLGVSGIPADSVHHVADDALCVRAIETIKRYFYWHHEHVQLTLFRVGRFHWAETSWPSAGEWSLVFILDSTATRVMGQY